MTPFTLRVTQSETKAPDTPYYLWKVAGKPVCVRMPFALMDRLGDEATESFRSLDSLGSEMGGVLFGRVIAGGQPQPDGNHDSVTHCVEDCVAVAWVHNGRPVHH